MDINFRFIGWCNETDSSGSKHDKVWTAFEVDGVYYAGWGARGKTLHFKKYGKSWSAESEQAKVMRSKRAPKGKYQEVDAFQLFAVFPFFKEDVEKYLTFGILANKIK